MELRINNLEELIVFIENHNLNNNELNSVIFNTLSVLCVKEIGRCYTKEDLIKDIEIYWNKYNQQECRPIFLDF